MEEVIDTDEDLRVIKSKIINTDYILSLIQNKSVNLHKLEKRYKKLTEKLVERDNEIEELKKKYEDVHERITECLGKYDPLEKEYSELKESYAGLQEIHNAYVNQTETKYQNACKEIEDLNKECNALKKKNDMVRSQIEKTRNTELLRKQFQDLNKRYKDLENERAQDLQDLKQLQTECDSLKRLLEEKNKLTKNNNFKSNLQKRVEELQQELKLSTDELEILKITHESDILQMKEKYEFENERLMKKLEEMRRLTQIDCERSNISASTQTEMEKEYYLGDIFTEMINVPSPLTPLSMGSCDQTEEVANLSRNSTHGSEIQINVRNQMNSFDNDKKFIKQKVILKKKKVPKVGTLLKLVKSNKAQMSRIFNNTINSTTFARILTDLTKSQFRYFGDIVKQLINNFLSSNSYNTRSARKDTSSRNTTCRCNLPQSKQTKAKIKTARKSKVVRYNSLSDSEEVESINEISTSKIKKFKAKTAEFFNKRGVSPMPVSVKNINSSSDSELSSDDDEYNKNRNIEKRNLSYNKSFFDESVIEQSSGTKPTKSHPSKSHKANILKPRAIIMNKYLQSLNDNKRRRRKHLEDTDSGIDTISNVKSPSSTTVEDTALEKSEYLNKAHTNNNESKIKWRTQIIKSQEFSETDDTEHDERNKTRSQINVKENTKEMRELNLREDVSDSYGWKIHRNQYVNNNQETSELKNKVTVNKKRNKVATESTKAENPSKASIARNTSEAQNEINLNTKPNVKITNKKRKRNCSQSDTKNLKEELFGSLSDSSCSSVQNEKKEYQIFKKMRNLDVPYFSECDCEDLGSKNDPKRDEPWENHSQNLRRCKSDFETKDNDSPGEFKFIESTLSISATDTDMQQQPPLTVLKKEEKSVDPTIISSKTASLPFKASLENDTKIDQRNSIVKIDESPEKLSKTMKNQSSTLDKLTCKSFLPAFELIKNDSKADNQELMLTKAKLVLAIKNKQIELKNENNSLQEKVFKRPANIPTMTPKSPDRMDYVIHAPKVISLERREEETETQSCDVSVTQTELTPSPTEVLPAVKDIKATSADSSVKETKVATSDVTKLNLKTAKKLVHDVATMDWNSTLISVVTDFLSRQDTEFVAQLIVNEAAKDFSQEFDKTFSPPAPLMTKTQQKLLTLLVRLEKAGLENLYECFIRLAEMRLLSEVRLEVVHSITRLYVAFCKLRHDIKKVRLLCCNAAYHMKDLYTPLMFIVLSIWADVLPTKSQNNGIHLATVLVQVVWAKKCSKSGYNLATLKTLLTKYYDYSCGMITDDEMMSTLVSSYLENCSKIMYTAILILGKNLPDAWNFRQIKKHLMPIVEININDNDKSQLVSMTIMLINRLLEHFDPMQSSEKISTIKNWLLRLSSNGGNFTTEDKNSLNSCITMLTTLKPKPNY